MEEIRGVTPILDRKAARERCNKAPPGPWKTFRNPMRDDGLFVAQDKPIRPYQGAGRNLDGSLPMPAVPLDVWSLGHQVDPDAAEFIAHSRIDLPAALDALDARDELLREIQWRGDDGMGDRCCPVCHGYEGGPPLGHDDDCAIAKMIGDQS